MSQMGCLNLPFPLYPLVIIESGNAEYCIGFAEQRYELDLVQ